MSLPRLQLFEFNDLAWVGSDLRDTIVESLSRGLRWGRTLHGLVAPLATFLHEAGTHEVLDVCAGAGGPAQILAEEFRRAGREPPQLLLTDLYPRTAAWARLAGLDAAVRGHPDPVDATAIPPELGSGRARVIINAFHHFPPALAARILADAVRSRAPIWVSEPFDRSPRMFLAFAPFGLAALLVNPVLTPERTLGKAVLAWGITPLTLAISAWDGFVSTFRAYEEPELRAMVAPLGDGYRWEYGTYDYALGGRGYYFYGVPIGPDA
jgi:hypothetical protein